MIIGGQDPVISPAASREFYDRLGSGDKTLSALPRRCFTSLSTSWAAQQVFDDLARWLDATAGGPIASGAADGGLGRHARSWVSAISIAFRSPRALFTRFFVLVAGARCRKRRRRRPGCRRSGPG